MRPRSRKRSSLYFLLIGLAALPGLLSGCTGSSPAGPSQPVTPNQPQTSTQQPTIEIRNTPCALPAEWEIEYQRSGGFAGRTQSLKVASAGEMQFTDVDTGRQSSLTLGAGELEQLQALLRQACPFETVKPLPPCADCFTYTLSVNLEGRVFQVQVNDLSISDSLRPLIESLNSYLQKMSTSS